MIDDPHEGELDTAHAPIDGVKQRVEEIQRRHRGKIRWRMTKHTAEIAIRALETENVRPSASARRSGKSRRRKRYKRLL